MAQNHSVHRNLTIGIAMAGMIALVPAVAFGQDCAALCCAKVAAQSAQSKTYDQRITISNKELDLGDARFGVISVANVAADDEDDDVLSIVIKRSSTNGAETIGLWINGKEIKVGSWEKALEILKKKGIGDGLKMKLDFNLQDPDFRGIKFDGPPGNDLGNVLQKIRIEPFGRSNDDDADELVIVREQPRPRAMLGVQLAEVRDDVGKMLGLDDDEGVLIVGVIDGTPAAKAGLRANDIVVGLGARHKEYAGIGVDEFRKVIGSADPGDKIQLRVVRGDDTRLITVKLAEWDPETLGTTGGLVELKEIEPLHRQLDLEQFRVFRFPAPGDDEDGGDRDEMILRFRGQPGMDFDVEAFSKEAMEHFRELMREHRGLWAPQRWEFRLHDDDDDDVDDDDERFQEIEDPLLEAIEQLERQMERLHQMIERLHENQRDLERKLRRQRPGSDA